MREQMKDTQQDEELIAAFKFFGAKDENDIINFETLQNALNRDENKENETFGDEDLMMIFNEIAGASSKPITSTNSNEKQMASIHGNSEDAESKQKGISFKDFMLMMMAK